MLCVVIPHNQESALKLRTQTQGVALGDKNETASVQHLLDQSCVTNEQLISENKAPDLPEKHLN